MKALVGSVVGAGASVALAAALLPVREHISVATAALVLVVPVIAGVMTGGFVAGVVSVAAGFVVYDWTFIPPYGRLSVANGQSWVALVVYAVVMLLVARLVDRLDRALAASKAREDNAHKLLALSEELLAERGVADLGRVIVDAVRVALGVPTVVLLLAHDGGLQPVAAAGEPLGDAELDALRPASRRPVALTTTGSGGELRTLALATPTRPVGLLVLRGVPAEPAVTEVLPVLANHLALALERSQLREQAMRAEVLEQVDGLRRALLGAVSHDLRTPLATIKVASSTLVGAGRLLGEDDADELHRLVDTETDRLTGLVTGLLDMSRIRAGVLGVKPEPTTVADLVREAVAARAASMGERALQVHIADHLPTVLADPLLVGQVFANLLENADRHAPAGTAVLVTAYRSGGAVAVAVTDRGPGVPAGERTAVFDSFVRFDTGGRSGLGLAIAKTFVEAHGQRIWVEDAPGGGARFVFTLAAAGEPAVDLPLAAAR